VSGSIFPSMSAMHTPCAHAALLPAAASLH
jgi:hypothetical protein